MGYDLTEQLISAASAVAKTPQVIVEIEGINTLYTAVSVKKNPRFDEGYFFDDPELFFDVAAIDPNAKDYINLEKSTRQITQQLNQDKGGSGSISSFNISIVDKDGFVTQEFSSQEMLSKRASVYLSFENLEHPENSIRIFSGIISRYDVLEGEAKLTVDNPDTLKEQEIFTQITDNLNGAIDASQTTITLDNTDGILIDQVKPSPVFAAGFSTYVQIDDEIIFVTNISGNDLLGCSRGQLGTTASSHGNGTDVTTFYRLQGNPIDTALRIMTSSRTTAYYKEDITPIAFDTYSGTTVASSVWFNYSDIADQLGVIEGDLLNIEGATTNNFPFVEILEIGQAEGFSYLVIDGTITNEPVLTGTRCAFISQYSTMPDGCSMGGEDIDIAQHLYIKDTYGQSFPDVDIYIREGVNAKDLIENELYFPMAAYALPRKGKASIGYTSPAVGGGSIVISEENITNALSIKTSRSVKKNFYNAVIYKLEEDALTEKFTRIINTLSEESQNRIKQGLKPYTIEAKALRSNQETENFVENASIRLLDRYKFGAVSFTLQVDYGTGFSIEVGDVIIFDGSNLGVYNFESGERGDLYKFMEITNKSLDISTGRVTVELTDTSYDIDGRYASFAPASLIGTGSTTTNIILKRSFGTADNAEEATKWRSYIGKKVLIHNSDWTFQETVTLTSISESNSFEVTVLPALSVAPTEDYIFDSPTYDNASNEYKAAVGFIGPVIAITSGTSGTIFDVSSTTNLFVGAFAQVSNADYSDFATSEIINIAGTTVTVKDDLGFTPSSNHIVARVGFVDDEGKAYLYL